MLPNQPPSTASSLKSGELAPLGAWQLRKWEDFARDWPMRVTRRWDKIHKKWRNYIECKGCDQFIFWLQDRNGQPYAWSEAEQLAQVVGHLRNIHRDLEMEVYQHEREDT
jgi:hypothetical protein